MSPSIRQLVTETGKYQILDEIDEGANAYAFKTHHLALDRDVFLKVYDVTDDMPKIFEEPQIIIAATGDSGTPHRNLVQVFDAERIDKEHALIAMEYVAGGSLLSRLPLPLMDAVRCMSGVLHGIARLHASCILHRDIKPGNIVVTDEAGILTPKLTDFGSAVKIADVSTVVSASRHSALYVPPEGWETPSRYDLRSDIYQAGLVLHELLHGPLPYTQDAYLDPRAKNELKERGLTWSALDTFHKSRLANQCLARRAATGKIVLLGDKRPTVPKKLARIINKAIKPDPDKRYQSAVDMISDLEAIHLPNFHVAAADHEIRAIGWQGYNWRVYPEGAGYRVSRQKPSSSTGRRWRGPFPTPREACQEISGFATT